MSLIRVRKLHRANNHKAIDMTCGVLSRLLQDTASVYNEYNILISELGYQQVTSWHHAHTAQYLIGYSGLRSRTKSRTRAQLDDVLLEAFLE